MKKQIEKLKRIMLITAAVFAFIIGCNISNIADFTNTTMDKFNPVFYNVSYTNSTTPDVVAAVSFNKNHAILKTSTGVSTLPIDRAVFTAIDPKAKHLNLVRSGLLAMLVALVCLVIPVLLVGLAFVVPQMIIVKNRRKAKALAAKANKQQKNPVFNVV